jgi:glycosyltransferase involved in cell wall biosynthesis
LIRRGLEQVCQTRPFDLIEFESRGAPGFRSIQARRTGLSFQDTGLIVNLRSTSYWDRHANHEWPMQADDLEVDYAERYVHAHADGVICESQDTLSQTARLGWIARHDVHLVPLVPSEGDLVPTIASAYLDMVRRFRTFHVRLPFTSPPVTVAMPYYNLGRYLPEALASLAGQTYPNLEVIVIDDGSTDPESVAVFAEMKVRYPHFRFLTQPNAGIGATRNRGLHEASGKYFLPMDADNIACPQMIERFVFAMERNSSLTALSCFHLAFTQADDIHQQHYAYAYRPTGGPHVLASIRNVYGDANAMFHTARLRAAGGFEPDRGTSWEDWEVFVKLVNAGYQMDVLPDHLFYYRHLDSGFSRITNRYANHQRVLRQFLNVEHLSAADRHTLWNAMAGFHYRIEELTRENRQLRDQVRLLRHRIADGLHAVLGRVPLAQRGVKWLLRSSWRTCAFLGQQLRRGARGMGS